MERYMIDNSVSEEEDDRFQRFGFAKRIAETIVQQRTSDSIVIGIYGNWGEGKSSVLNFIEKNLVTDPDIVVCKFNPWRFEDHNQLLIGFFKLLTTRLKKSLQNSAEKLSQAFAEYADFIIPNVSLLKGAIELNTGEGVKKFLEKYSTLSIEEQKKELKKFSKKKENEW